MNQNLQEKFLMHIAIFLQLLPMEYHKVGKINYRQQQLLIFVSGYESFIRNAIIQSHKNITFIRFQIINIFNIFPDNIRAIFKRRH